VEATIIREAAARAKRAARFDMTAGPVLVTVAVRTSAPVECASGHIAVSSIVGEAHANVPSVEPLLGTARLRGAQKVKG
jgi:hypothetical protein